MAGALTERDFVAKLEKVGFEGIEVLDRRSMSIEDAELYPLFTDDLLDLMRRLIPAKQQRELAVSVVISARLTADR